MRLEIVTPEGKTCSEEVDMVTLPGKEGELGIYPLHVPLMTEIVPGEISVRKGAQYFYLAVGPGFAEITGDHVFILTDMAIRADDLDQAKAEEACRAAAVRLGERLSAEDAAMVNAAIMRSLEQVRGRKRQRKK
jgi:F-type H+-transporting ATPase subunit epsilon